MISKEIILACELNGSVDYSGFDDLTDVLVAEMSGVWVNIWFLD